MSGLLARLLGRGGQGERRRTVEVGWLVDAEKSGFIYDAPRGYQRKAPAAASAKAVGYCPAVVDYEARHIEVTCPVDMHLRLGKDDNGQYRLEFDLAPRADDQAALIDRFFQRISVDLLIGDVARSYHVPVLLSPYSLTTYRGS